MDDDLKARLLKPRLSEETLEIDGIGEIRVRGLSRGEVFAAQKTTKGDVMAMERRVVSLGMVDPPMTEHEVEQWQRNSPAGEMEAVSVKINELSGLTKTAEKAAYAEFRDEPGPGVRDVPGPEAGDDSGATAGADDQ
jgi:hypothetical protein